MGLKWILRDRNTQNENGVRSAWRGKYGFYILSMALDVQAERDMVRSKGKVLKSRKVLNCILLVFNPISLRAAIVSQRRRISACQNVDDWQNPIFKSKILAREYAL